MEFFPAPDFESDDSDVVEGEGEVEAVPKGIVECSFYGMDERQFDTLCPVPLKYDSRRPVYSTSSCQIYIARTIQDPPKYYALKSSQYVRRMRQEDEIRQVVGAFPTIISYHDTWMSKGQLFIQLELAKEGSIKQRLFEFTRDQIWLIFSHVINALQFIHSKRIMHLDVSPANILQTEQSGKSVFKLTDFGTALKFGDFSEGSEGAGPYVSPEALSYPHGHAVGPATDIFSFGVVMMELLSKKPAPRGDNKKYELLRRGDIDFDFIDDEFDFVRKMLDPNPENRPTADELANLPRVRAEWGKILELGDRTETGAYSVRLETPKTPRKQNHRIPPETPYAQRYGSKRRIELE